MYYLLNIKAMDNDLLPDRLREPHRHLAEAVLNDVIENHPADQITDQLLLQTAAEIEKEWEQHAEWKANLDIKRGAAA